MRKLEEQELRQRGRELRALLNEWDPVGVSPDGPKDEYDCLLWQVMRRLEDQVPATELTAFLATELRKHFGLVGDLGDIGAFVSRARSWFETTWKDTRV